MKASCAFYTMVGGAFAVYLYNLYLYKKNSAKACREIEEVNRNFIGCEDAVCSNKLTKDFAATDHLIDPLYQHLPVNLLYDGDAHDND